MSIRMPEPIVFVRAMLCGTVLMAVWSFAYCAGMVLSISVATVSPILKLLGAVVCLSISAAYLWQRGALGRAKKIFRSGRVDLLIAFLAGAWLFVLLDSSLKPAYVAVAKASPYLALLFLVIAMTFFLSPLVRTVLSSRSKRPPSQLYFLSDEGIDDEAQDVLAAATPARSFANAVIASDSDSSLVFGVDGPWGVGKTSFLNLAARHWEGAEGGSFIVFRFEPLRYAMESDLADRFIRELSSAIQRRLFVPEFKPAASRYSRMLKGKADLSFLGFKLSLEPTSETMDELLDDIDEVLKETHCRVIVIVDDLDRLDAKTVNNVLFVIRRTFKLSRATYVLCYDTENLVAGKDDGEKAREFLEKFITIKFSIFVDGASIRDFLLRDWRSKGQVLRTVPSDTMEKLASIATSVAELVSGSKAARYAPLLGDMRKVKRFMNALLLLQMESADLEKMDFNKHDLINLLLLYLNYPGVFRKIYAQETEGRVGDFSVRVGSKHPRLSNSPELEELVADAKRSDQFLLSELFSAKGLRFEESSESELRSRACFNHANYRNLEKYLRLIVRFVRPQPLETFKFYENAVESIRDGGSVEDVLGRDGLNLANGDDAQDQFWSIATSMASELGADVLMKLVDHILSNLPAYSAVDLGRRGMRDRLIYSMLRMLDAVGSIDRPKQARGQWVSPSVTSVIFAGAESRRGIIERLTEEERGVLGWHDLLLFRLQCSADRGGQLFNVQAVLIAYSSPDHPLVGRTDVLAVQGMRRFSQLVYAAFKKRYIVPAVNFLKDASAVTDEQLLGEIGPYVKGRQDLDEGSLSDALLASKSALKTFVLYQLANNYPPTGSGVGCGFYDPEGDADTGRISKEMNRYIFQICFNPLRSSDNSLLFVDHCLSNLSSGILSGDESDGYIPTVESISSGFDRRMMGRFWSKHGGAIRAVALKNLDRKVVTGNYSIHYAEHTEALFSTLDSIAQLSGGKGES